MVNFKRFLVIALIALLGVLGWMNRTALTQPVELSFFQYSLTLMFGLWFLIALGGGILVYMMFTVPGSVSMRRELRYKSNELARLEFELSRSQGDTQAMGPMGNPMAAAYPQDDIAKRLGL